MGNCWVDPSQVEQKKKECLTIDRKPLKKDTNVPLI
jgi:hypothetical protein